MLLVFVSIQQHTKSPHRFVSIAMPFQIFGLNKETSGNELDRDEQGREDPRIKFKVKSYRVVRVADYESVVRSSEKSLREPALEAVHAVPASQQVKEDIPVISNVLEGLFYL